MRKIIPILFSIFVIAVIYAVFNLGVFKDVEIKEGTYPELKLLYRDHIGPYHKISEIIIELEKWAQANNVDCRITFGQFLDNPGVVEHERLRSRGGCVVQELPETLPPDTHTMTIHERNYYIATFEGSPWIGPYKVYNKVYQLADQQKVEISEPVIELYEVRDQNRMKTTYLFPKP